MATLFAYGQTGSGKTFTVSRLEELVANAMMQMQDERRVFISITELAGNTAFGN